MVNAWKTQYIISGWLHTPYQTIFIVIYWILKISSLFDHYLWNSPVKRGGQPHGSDQCGYIHLLYRFIFCFTVVGVEHLCRLGWVGLQQLDTSAAGGTQAYYYLLQILEIATIAGNCIFNFLAKCCRIYLSSWILCVKWKVLVFGIPLVIFAAAVLHALLCALQWD